MLMTLASSFMIATRMDAFALAGAAAPAFPRQPARTRRRALRALAALGLLLG